MSSKELEKETYEVNVQAESDAVSTESPIDNLHHVKSVELEVDHAVGADLFQEVLEQELKYDDKEYAKIRRKIDKWLLPVLCITYLLQFLDKLSLN